MASRKVAAPAPTSGRSAKGNPFIASTSKAHGAEPGAARGDPCRHPAPPSLQDAQSSHTRWLRGHVTSGLAASGGPKRQTTEQEEAPSPSPRDAHSHFHCSSRTSPGQRVMGEEGLQRYRFWNVKRLWVEQCTQGPC